MSHKTRSRAVSIRGASGTDSAGKAKLPTFEGNAYTGEVMKPDGWYGRIIVDLDGVKVPNEQTPALRQHDHEQVVGHTGINVTKAGVEVSGTLSGEKHHVAKVAEPAANGFKWQLSIGANPVRTEYLESGKETIVNGRKVSGPLDIARETEISEVSFVPLGADNKTSVHITASVPRKGKAMFAKEGLRFARSQGIKAAKYSDEEIDKMSDEDAKAALKKCMGDDEKPKGKAKAADEEEEVDADDEPDTKGSDEEEDDEEEEEEKPKAKAKSSKGKGMTAKTKLGKQFRAEMAKEFAAERRRQASIVATTAKYGVVKVKLDGNEVDLVAHAVEQGWSAEKAELHALRAARPGAGIAVPGGLAYSTSAPEINEATVEAAIFQAARHEFRLDDPEFFFDNDQNGKRRRVPAHIEQQTAREMKARYTDQVQQAAHTQFKGRIGLQEMLTIMARMNGYRGPEVIRDDGAMEEVLRCQTWSNRPGIRADGASGASIQNVLANVLNKFMLQGYLFVEQAWRQIAAIRPVKDFKPTKYVSLLGDVMFKPIGSTGELQNASLGDQAFSNQANSYGRILTIGRQQIINDDLGILTTSPMKIGQGAGLVLNDTFWKAFLSPGNADDGNPFWNNSAGFHGAAPSNQVQALANLLTGAATAMSSTAIQAVKQQFDKQLDPNGNPLGFDAAKPLLLFPPELWQTAMELVDPAAVGIVYGGASNARQPNVNLWKGRFEPVMSRYLSNANYANYSALAWYILFNPAALPVIEACFLNGVDTPTVQTASPDFQFDRLGMSIRGILDFGVNMQNFRGGVKAAGS